MKIARLPDGSPEIFHTLQGEGVSIGVPAVFVRASLCNLHCRWCDTDYTWNWQGTPWPHERDSEPGYQKYRKDDWLIEMTPADVAAAVSDFNCRRLVVTGGEPLLQQEEFLDVLEILHERDARWVVEIETNGTIPPDPDLDERVTQYNVSPKLANSGNPEALRVREAALTGLAATGKAWFKFVIAQASDLKEVEALAARFTLRREQIILMPEGRLPEILHTRSQWLADQCRERGYRFSDRLHVNLWGTQRGR